MSDIIVPASSTLAQALEHTPARVLTGRAGTGYRTSTWLKLREDHAVARDAVSDQLDMEATFGSERIASLGLFAVQSQARSRAEYLMRPDRGRKLDAISRQRICESCPAGADLQIVIGDGLSACAVRTHALGLLELLLAQAKVRGWIVGCPFVVRFCRVGILNELGALLQARVVVLLIGERPGLATAESLSAYMAYQPQIGHTDANRNLISNIHSQGVPTAEAATRIMRLAEQFRAAARSGVEIKEEELSADLKAGRLNELAE